MRGGAGTVEGEAAEEAVKKGDGEEAEAEEEEDEEDDAAETAAASDGGVSAAALAGPTMALLDSSPARRGRLAAGSEATSSSASLPRARFIPAASSRKKGEAGEYEKECTRYPRKSGRNREI